MSLPLIRKSIIFKSLMVIALGIAGPVNAAPSEFSCGQKRYAHEGGLDLNGWRVDMVAAIRQMYAALRKVDLPALQECIAPNFFAFDGGRRYTADSFIEAIRIAHGKGVKFELPVDVETLQLVNNFAFITLKNRGSIETTKGRDSIEWLTSAVMEYRDGAWRVNFLHSTQVP